MKDLIFTTGGVIVPAEVEETLVEQNGVLDAGVIELPRYVFAKNRRRLTDVDVMQVVVLRRWEYTLYEQEKETFLGPRSWTSYREKYPWRSRSLEKSSLWTRSLGTL